jgi:hypothetical protein
MRCWSETVVMRKVRRKGLRSGSGETSSQEAISAGGRGWWSKGDSNSEPLYDAFVSFIYWKAESTRSAIDRNGSALKFANDLNPTPYIFGADRISNDVVRIVAHLLMP